ncbi:type I restriction endonuclease, partial [Escherichia coli]|nr:type I restriction endonuclease [Escherichia coli]
NIEVSKDGNTQGELASLIDFNDPTNNAFLVINQLTIKEGNHTRRPDLILFINGLPLVVIELKNATDENATVLGAYNQIKTYQNQIPSLFTYNA